MGAIDYWKLAFSRYATFTGRSRRSEYWYFTLVNFIVSFVLSIALGLLGETAGLLANLYGLVVLIPGIAVGVRRLHDIGRSGWWYLILLTVIGAFLLLFWFAQDSEPGTNQYGPNPKTGGEDVLDHLTV